LVQRLGICIGAHGQTAPAPAQNRPAPLAEPRHEPLVSAPVIAPSLGSVPAVERPPLAPPAAPSAQNSAGAGTGLRILLAEDNPVNALLIRELLRRRGHSIKEVTTGTAAVEAMEAGSYDLLLTDIHMPGMDGIEAAKAIRAMEARNNRARTPIVALTADALETGKRACQDAGMDGFLTKPVDPAELEEMFLMLFPSEDGLPQTAAA
jgi:CheY-like chemotaxis protein